MMQKGYHMLCNFIAKKNKNEQGGVSNLTIFVHNLKCPWNLGESYNNNFLQNVFFFSTFIKSF